MCMALCALAGFDNLITSGNAVEAQSEQPECSSESGCRPRDHALPFCHGVLISRSLQISLHLSGLRPVSQFPACSFSIFAVSTCQLQHPYGVQRWPDLAVTFRLCFVPSRLDEGVRAALTASRQCAWMCGFRVDGKPVLTHATSAQKPLQLRILTKNFTLNLVTTIKANLSCTSRVLESI